MQIQVNTDRNTDGRDTVADYVRGIVEDAVSHFSRHVTRVEVHLGDENGAKSGADDKRCMMEARVEKQRPLAVSHYAATLDEAIDGAAGKLRRTLEHNFGRLRARR